jgi:Ca-activated chloride channel family protein
MNIFRLAQPWMLLLGVLVPLLAYWYFFHRDRRTPAIRYSNVGFLEEAGQSWRSRLRHLPFALRMLVLTCIVVALARPQTGSAEEEITAEGIDIVLALDVSTSMLAEDLQPNRLEAAKRVAVDFIDGRRNDRIGLVVFARQGFTQCPLSLDYRILKDLLAEVRTGLIDDGTAIGMGLVTAVNRLRESSAASRIVVLLTDGRNNQGEIDPLTAAEMARTMGIKVYTIGAGAKGLAPYPVQDPIFGRRYAQVEVDIDEEVLQETARATGGKYFRATDTESLRAVYQEIDRLEKSEVTMTQFTRYRELFPYPLGLASVLLLVELVLANTRFRRIP